MPRLEACLVDAYDTIVTCDFTPLREGVPALAGIPVAAWEQEYTLVGPMLNDGRLSKAQAFRQIMASCGAQATDDLIGRVPGPRRELDHLGSTGLRGHVIAWAGRPCHT